MPGCGSLGGFHQASAGCAPFGQATPGVPANFLLQAEPIRIIGDREIRLQHDVLGDVERRTEDWAPRPPRDTNATPSIGRAGGALITALPRADAFDLDPARVFRARVGST